ncbi:MAG: TatD family hydrolase [Deltaproteobacteria bacterium]|nr:TatD family hydrolase [Deltaproteobacteria bacterium]
MYLIDTHSHLDTFIEDVPAVLKRAVDNHVKKLISIGAGDGLGSNDLSAQLAEKYDNIWFSLGIHPHDSEKYPDLLALEKYFSSPKLVAMGETGLDYFRDWAPQEAQRSLFRQTIRIAKELKKPLIIHCRDAAEETMRILIEEQAQDVGGVFHCYAEDATFAEKLIDLNFFVSFTGIITFKKALDRQEAARLIPLDQIFLETDSPYMAPEPYRGQASEPGHVYYIAKKLAEIKGISLEEVADQTSRNAEKLFPLISL